MFGSMNEENRKNTNQIPAFLSKAIDDASSDYPTGKDTVKSYNIAMQNSV